jgi:preprotein translocase subunit SecD
MKNEVIAGLIGMLLLSAFLLGLAGSIGQPPFWVIVVLVLTGAWTAWLQDTVRNPDAD